ncbi:hypothetical protein GOY07_00305 [Wolbachia endosymbiont of Litomosoides sigmodontis]|uniref:hypothetical protein n=1 Tax=Wolbachia endosymbiont of Litomosoides sigmodontis TaxID=80850 RepID=UPI00158E016C|nr:hypothetical protein [Wolbachia endosymbiont of Litomosoides sigmodontis]QKX02703.1 hypothetical protein GOY07_00305 [Wolbachia endosymbiont of Litomosoides sigmodontis]
MNEEIWESVKGTLERVRNNAYIKKLNAVIAVKKHNVITVAKIFCISRTVLTAQIKYLKFRKEEKLFASP